MAKLLNPREEERRSPPAFGEGRQRFRDNQSDRSVHREGSIGGELKLYPTQIRFLFADCYAATGVRKIREIALLFRHSSMPIARCLVVRRG